MSPRDKDQRPGKNSRGGESTTSGKRSRGPVSEDNVVYLNFGGNKPRSTRAASRSGVYPVTPTERGSGAANPLVGSLTSIHSRTSSGHKTSAKGKQRSHRPVISNNEPDYSMGLWAGQSFMDYVESRIDSGRRSRGKDYFINGNVVEVEYAPGTIVASVSGSQLTPFLVSFGFTVSKSDIETAIEYLAKNPTECEQFLKGEFVSHVAELLFPVHKSIRCECTCPDPHPICKHMYAVAATIDEEFAMENFKYLQVTGMTRLSLEHKIRTAARSLGIPEPLKEALEPHKNNVAFPSAPPENPFADASHQGEGDHQGAQGGGRQQPGGTHCGSNSAGGGDNSGSALDTESARHTVDTEQFWGESMVLPPIYTPQPSAAIDDHDPQRLLKALSWVSYGALGQLKAKDTLEECYFHLINESSPQTVVDSPATFSDEEE